VTGDQGERLLAAQLKSDLAPGRHPPGCAVVAAAPGEHVELLADEDRRRGLGDARDAGPRQDVGHAVPVIRARAGVGQVVEQRQEVRLAAAELRIEVEDGRGLPTLAHPAIQAAANHTMRRIVAALRDRAATTARVKTARTGLQLLRVGAREPRDLDVIEKLLPNEPFGAFWFFVGKNRLAASFSLTTEVHVALREPRTKEWTMSRFLATPLVAALVLTGMLGVNAPQAKASDPCYQIVTVYERVTVCEVRTVPYICTVTVYDDCGCPHEVQVTLYRQVKVHVTKYVPVPKRVPVY
jgi:hypothetical protein